MAMVLKQSILGYLAAIAVAATLFAAHPHSKMAQINLALALTGAIARMLPHVRSFFHLSRASGGPLVAQGCRSHVRTRPTRLNAKRKAAPGKAQLAAAEG